MKNLIQGHNSKLLSVAEREVTDRPCNCRNKALCPLQGKCQVKNVIYKATVTSSKGVKHYIGSTGGEFKKRFYNHTSSFKHPQKKFSTELSKYIWKLKEKNIDYKIEWKILRKIKQRNEKLHKICQTCNLERIEIALADKRSALNRRSEMTGKCVHFQNSYF